MLATGTSPELAAIRDWLVILASASLIALVMQRMRLAVIPAYLLAGAILGPHALGLIPSPERLASVGRLAVVLLMFGIGLELHFSALRHNLLRMLLAGGISSGLTVLLGWPVAMAFGQPAPAALVIAVALSMSSTVVVLRIIAQRRELRQVWGRMALAISVVQDLQVLPMLLALPLLAHWAGVLPAPEITSVATGEAWSDYAGRIAVGLLGVIAIIVVGRLALPRLLHESLRAGSLELLMIVGVAAALSAAALAQAVGLSLEMGAFLAGFILAGTPFRHQLSGQVGPLRDLFMAAFFTTVGMKLDPAALLEWWWVILLGGVVMVSLKALLIGATCWSLGATATVAAAVGLSLAQAGEFSLVLLDAAHRQGILSDTTLANTAALAVLALFLTPLLVDLGRHARRWLGHIPAAPWISRVGLAGLTDMHVELGEQKRHVIIAGYGPVGWLIAAELDRFGVQHTIIELNPRTVRKQSARGKRIIFGDAGNPEVLESAGIARAEALILTIPDEAAVLRACAIARSRAPNIYIAARIGVVSERSSTVKSGADHVTIDEITTAGDMLRAVMKRLGLPGPDPPEQS